ncbi:MAG: FecR domain-containing protein [Burkholderiales bacterium]
MSTPRFRPSRDAALALMVSSALSTFAHAQVARVQFANGQVSATGSDGTVRSLARGAAITEGDTVSTEQGRAQLRFADGALVSLQPRTTFRIDEFRFKEKEEGEERGFFSLLRGGLRTITGLIGRTNRDSYRVRTSTATIGIRGTEYLAEVTDNLRVAVGGGTIAITNEAGTFVIEQGQSAFVANQNSSPVITFEKPLLPPPQAVAALPQLPQDERAGDRRDTPLCESASGGTECSTLPPPTEPPTEPPLEPPTVPAVAAFGLDASLFLASGNAQLNDANQVVAFSDPATGENFRLGTASVQNAFHDGTVGVGRWTDGTFTAKVDRGDGLEELSIPVGPNQGLHYAFTTAPTAPMPAANIATYNALAATRATSTTGALGLGTFAPGQGAGQPVLAVNFATGKVGMDFTVTFSSAGYRVQTTGGIGGLTGSEVALLGASAPFVFANSSSVPTTGIAGSACASGCSADVLGFFGGANAVRTGFSYEIDDAAAALKVHGAAAGTQAELYLPVVTNMLAAYADDSTSATIVTSNGTAQLAPSGRVTMFDGSGCCLVAMDQKTASFAPGEHAYDGTIGFGRLSNGTATVDGGEGAGFSALNLTANQGLHYVFGTLTSPALASGSASFTLQGATKATSASGTLGLGSFSGAMAVDFALGRVGLDFNVNFGSNNYHVVTTGGLGNTASSEVLTFGPSFSGSGLPTTNPAGCASSCTSSVQGFFAGAGAARAGLGYRIFDDAETIAGAAAFTQSGFTPAPGGGTLVGSSVAMDHAGAHDPGSLGASDSFLKTGTTGAIDSFGKLLRFFATSGLTTIGSAVTAPGESANDGIIGWSRWSGGTLGGTSDHAGGAFSGSQSFHNVFGAPTPLSDMTALQSGGVTASYSLLGATNPTTDAIGAMPGTLSSASLTANFGSGTVSFNANLNVNAAAYAIGAAGLPITGSGFSGSSSGYTTGSACASGCSTSIHGFFAGAMAARAGVAYNIQNGSGKFVNGAAAFTKAP